MSPLALASGLPLSSDSSSASCSPFALISSASAYIRPARLEGLTFRKGPSSAVLAAAERAWAVAVAIARDASGPSHNVATSPRTGERGGALVAARQGEERLVDH